MTAAEALLSAGREIHDPRPAVAMLSSGWAVVGTRCPHCRYPAIDPFPRCPDCGKETEATAFRATGTVFSSTVVRVPIPGRTPPYGVAYLDLDDGPRIVAHVAGTTERVIAVGSRAQVIGVNQSGDVLIEEVAP